MKTDRAKKIEATAVELFARQRLEAVEAHFTADYTVHVTGADLRGHAPIVQFFRAIHRAFPVLAVETEVLLEREETVAWQRTLRGVQKGALQGFPAIDAEIVWREMVVSKFIGDLIIEEWVVSDLAERLLRARKSSSRV